MSHFAVLCVLGPDVAPDNLAAVQEAVDSLLAPYDENMEVDAYRDYDADIPNRLLHLNADAYAETALQVPPSVPERNPDLTREQDQAAYKAYRQAANAWLTKTLEKIDRYEVVRLLNENSDDDEEYGYDARKGYYRMSTYNPESKWDWYEVGGRWMGYFLTKPGVKPILGRPGVFNNEADPGSSDILRVKDIDFEAMGRRVIDQRERALANYDAAMREGEVVRLVAATVAARFLPWDINLDDPDWRTKYLGQPVSPATYAWVDKDGWKAKGAMGWWGVSNDTQTDEEWAKAWMIAISQLDPETTVAVVDCHI